MGGSQRPGRDGLLTLQSQMHQEGKDMSIAQLCRWFGVPRASFYYAPQFARNLKDLKIGMAAIDFEQWADPSARPDFAKAVEVIRSLGVQMTPAKLPDFPEPFLPTVKEEQRHKKVKKSKADSPDKQPEFVGSRGYQEPK